MIIGIILTVIGIISLKSFFSKNEWRAPLIELSAELEENIQIKNHKKSIKYKLRRKAFDPLNIFFKKLK